MSYHTILCDTFDFCAGRQHRTMPCARVEVEKVTAQLEIARVEAAKWHHKYGLLLKCGYKIRLILWFGGCVDRIR